MSDKPKQMGIIVSYDYRESKGKYGLDMLNEHLASGWTVIQMCPMPSGAGGDISSQRSSCLVIIQEGSPV